MCARVYIRAWNDVQIEEKNPHLYHNLNFIVLATDIPKFVKQKVDLEAHACRVSGRPYLLLRVPTCRQHGIQSAFLN